MKVRPQNAMHSLFSHFCCAASNDPKFHQYLHDTSVHLRDILFLLHYVFQSNDKREQQWSRVHYSSLSLSPMCNVTFQLFPMWVVLPCHDGTHWQAAPSVLHPSKARRQRIYLYLMLLCLPWAEQAVAALWSTIVIVDMHHIGVSNRMVPNGRRLLVNACVAVI